MSEGSSIVLGALLGFAVGLERWLRGSAAGERTFALAAMGAAACTRTDADEAPP